MSAPDTRPKPDTAAEVRQLRAEVAELSARLDNVHGDVLHLRKVADTLAAAVAQFAPMLQNPSGMLSALMGGRGRG